MCDRTRAHASHADHAYARTDNNNIMLLLLWHTKHNRGERHVHKCHDMYARARPTISPTCVRICGFYNIARIVAA